MPESGRAWKYRKPCSEPEVPAPLCGRGLIWLPLLAAFYGVASFLAAKPMLILISKASPSRPSWEALNESVATSTGVHISNQPVTFVLGSSPARSAFVLHRVHKAQVSSTPTGWCVAAPGRMRSRMHSSSLFSQTRLPVLDACLGQCQRGRTLHSSRRRFAARFNSGVAALPTFLR